MQSSKQKRRVKKFYPDLLFLPTASRTFGMMYCQLIEPFHFTFTKKQLFLKNCYLSDLKFFKFQMRNPKVRIVNKNNTDSQV
jgi:hypothetical protein